MELSHVFSIASGAVGVLAGVAGMWAKLGAIRRAHDAGMKEAVERETRQNERIGQLQKGHDKLERRLEEGSDSFKELRGDMADLKACIARVDERTKQIQSLMESAR